MALKFCQKCKTLLSPHKKENKIFLECLNCGFSIGVSDNVFLVSREKIPRKELKGGGAAENKDFSSGYKNVCKECGYDKASVIDMGIFYSDEDNLILLKCNKCGAVERIGDKVS